MKWILITGFSVVALITLAQNNSPQFPAFSSDNELHISLIVDPEGYDYKVHPQEQMEDSKPGKGFDSYFEKYLDLLRAHQNIDMASLNTQLSFGIGNDGKLSDFEILDNSTDQADSALLSCLKQLGNWGSLEKDKLNQKVTLSINSRGEQVFRIAEEDAHFPGNWSAFYRYINDNIEYPAEATKKGLEGKVYVEFIVERDGALSEIEVVRGLSENCDKETIRLIKNCPKWIPAKQNGHHVRRLMVLPIVFNPEQAQRKNKI